MKRYLRHDCRMNRTIRKKKKGNRRSRVGRGTPVQGNFMHELLRSRVIWHLGKQNSLYLQIWCSGKEKEEAEWRYQYHTSTGMDGCRRSWEHATPKWTVLGRWLWTVDTWNTADAGRDFLWIFRFCLKTDSPKGTWPPSLPSLGRTESCHRRWD